MVGCALVRRPSKTAGVQCSGSALNVRSASVDGEPAADGSVHFSSNSWSLQTQERVWMSFRKYAYEGVDLESESQ